ncbi:tyrosine-type recombinase/integrase [Clostridium sp. MCC353]|uniref:tyrosine-type recombinase/integrase n=1 Tax=Clostridium sp. MCC353 TaxID=2592646 RepID=UPI001C023176|nr:tyrosine-type recombinase/integrase [Clostridium sp. MCC353]MBT9777067.1 tyrosine-type recombinase/integrase [Clostridium sp. MCC353]
MVLSMEMIPAFEKYLYEQERSQATIKKYIRDLKKLFTYLAEDLEISKEKMIRFKQELTGCYKPASVNSILAAVNHFLEFAGLGEYKVKQVRVQKTLFCQQERELSKEEYFRLVNAAKQKKNQRISVLMQAICSTGIRVSEHRFITAEALKEGYFRIYNKGKSRIVFLPPELIHVLKQYCLENGIEHGPVFITKSGRPLDRSNIWSMMKALCGEAGVDQKKVYPHNLRHLFAFTFYGVEKDLLRLADILGHTSVDTTRIYTVSSGWEHKRILSKLGLVQQNEGQIGEGGPETPQLFSGQSWGK